MNDTLATLYPEEALDTRVVLRLPAPRLAAPPGGAPNTGTVHAYYGENLLRELALPGGDRLSFIDNAFPHSRYGLMLLVDNDSVRSSFAELQPLTQEALMEVAVRYVEYLSSPAVRGAHSLDGGHFHACFNYSKYTTDRENGMFYDKRYHLHLNYYPLADLGQKSAPVRWSAIDDSSLRRRFIDPIAFLGSSVAFDAAQGTLARLPLLPIDHERDRSLALPPGLKIQLCSWNDLRQASFREAVSRLHDAAERAYGEVYEAFVGRPFQPVVWHRPSLLPSAEVRRRLAGLHWLSPASRDGLFELARLLRNVTEDELRAFREDEPLRVRKLALGGLDYSIGLFSPQPNTELSPLDTHGPVYLVMQFRLFGDIGSAGLAPIGDVPIVRIDRKNGPILTPSDIKDRTKLRQGFLEDMYALLTARYSANVLH
jgi:hypothetical protein